MQKTWGRSLLCLFCVGVLAGLPAFAGGDSRPVFSASWDHTADAEIILFAYAVSDEACQILEDALDNGAKHLIVRGLGETNEFGTQREAPALKRFLGRDAVKYLDVDMSERGTEREARETFLTTLVDLLGDERPLILNAWGRDVEAGVLEKPDGGTFVSLVNWDARDATVDLGLRLSPGPYRVTKYSSGAQAPGRLGNAAAIAAADLRSFRLDLKAGETVVLTVMR